MITTEYRLGELVKITSGGTPNRSNPDYYKGGSIPWVRTGDLKAKYIFQTPKHITKLGLEKSSAKLFPANTVLVALYGATIGATSILNIEASTNQACAALLPSEKVDHEFLYYFIKSIKDELISKGVGGGQPNISGKILKEVKIDLPSLVDQKRISSILENTESLINHREESIELADEFLKHTFLTMFENGEYETNTLENLVQENCPLTYGIVQPGEEVNSGVPVVRPVDQTNEYIGLEGLKLIDPAISEKFKRTILKGGEILLCVRGTTGLLSIAKDELSGANVTRGITPIWFSEEFNTQFAYHLLKSERVQRVIQEKTYGATLKQINLRDVRLINLIKPPIELQNEFAKIAQGVFELKKHFHQSLIELNELYRTLSHKAFNGELIIIEKIEIEGTIKIQPKISATVEVIEQKQPATTIPKPVEKKEEVNFPIIHIPFLKTEEDLLSHISRKCSSSHFTFTDIKEAVKGLDWKYDFEELKNLVFSLVRKQQLKQIFADASYKSGFNKADADFKEISGLSEQIYFKRMLK